MTAQILTQEYLHTIFEYKDGELFWKQGGTGIVRKNAGWIDKLGYKNIGINRKTYKAHRLIFLMFNGYLPSCIDHIDGNPSNNHIENLRQGEKYQNSWNQKNRITNTSGHKGISWSKRANKWVARCMMHGKSNFLGQYEKLHEAVEIVRKFREDNQGEFARHH